MEGNTVVVESHAGPVAPAPVAPAPPAEKPAYNPELSKHVHNIYGSPMDQIFAKAEQMSAEPEAPEAPAPDAPAAQDPNQPSPSPSLAREPSDAIAPGGSPVGSAPLTQQDTPKKTYEQGFAEMVVADLASPDPETRAKAFGYVTKYPELFGGAPSAPAEPAPAPVTPPTFEERAATIEAKLLEELRTSPMNKRFKQKLKPVDPDNDEYTGPQYEEVEDFVRNPDDPNTKESIRLTARQEAQSEELRELRAELANREVQMREQEIRTFEERGEKELTRVVSIITDHGVPIKNLGGTSKDFFVNPDGTRNAARTRLFEREIETVLSDKTFGARINAMPGMKGQIEKIIGEAAKVAFQNVVEIIGPARPAGPQGGAQVPATPAAPSTTPVAPTSTASQPGTYPTTGMGPSSPVSAPATTSDPSLSPKAAAYQALKKVTGGGGIHTANASQIQQALALASPQ